MSGGPIAAVWLTALAEWRQRWRSLVVTTLLAGLAGGVVLAAYVGSRRADTSFDRLLERQRSPNVLVGVDGPPDAARVRDAAKLPGVEVALHAVVMIVAPAGSGMLAGQDSIAMVVPVAAGADPADVFFVVEGRWYDERRADELVVNEAMRDRLDARIGDRLTLVSLTPEQWATVDAGGDFPSPAGPRPEVTLVGVARVVEDVSDAPDPRLVVTPAFYDRYVSDIAHGDQVGLLADTDRLPEIERGIRALFGEDVTIEAAEDPAARIEDAIAVGVDGSRAFALLAGLAGLVALGQALVREAEIMSVQHPVRRALGMTSGQLIASGVTAALPVAAGGALLAAIGAEVGGPLAVTGLARQAEPDPGVWFDPIVVPGAALVGLVVLALAAAAAARGAAGHRARRARASPTAGFVAGLPPRIGIGVRMALERGRGRGTLPSGSALAGAVLGVAGLVVALDVGGRVDHLLANPRLWGANYDAIVVAGEGASAHERTAEQVGRDPAVEAVAVFDSLDVAVHAGQRRDQVAAVTVRDHEGTIPPVVPQGRAPAAPDEVAVGREALDHLDVDIGDVVMVDHDQARVPLRVVGSYLHPEEDDANSAMLMTSEGFAALSGEDDDSGVLVRFAPDVDEDAALRRLRQLGERVDVTSATEDTPSNIDNLDELGAMPFLLAAFAVLLAAIATAHTLVLATRRRRRDLAVLRVLGFVGGQLRSIIRWQALTTAAGGLAVGVPAGLVAARRIWSTLAGEAGVIDDWALPWPVVVLALPAAGAVAVILALLPGRTAARLSPGRVLRTE